MMFTTIFSAVLTAIFFSTAAGQQFVMYTPGGDDPAVERIDPILAPGTISQHVHQVFGSNGLSNAVSYDSLQDATCTTVADASGNGNSQDKSIYWHPAMFMELLDGTGYVRVKTNGHKLYYKNAGSEKDTLASPFEFPKGFRMLAGNPFIRKALSDVQQQNITQWICHDTSGTNQGTDGGFPTGVNNCAAYDGLNGAIHFPHCWNGDDFNPAAPAAHVVYPTGDIQNGVCPSSHPTRLPHIFMENTFDINPLVGLVKQDSFVLAQGDNTGYGWHADFYNGWDSGAIPNLLDNCVQGRYGNEDVGSCSTFQRGSAASACQLSTTYNEKVDKPGQYLPGCNPIVDTNPAPIQPIAAINVATNVCGAGSSPTSVGTSTYSTAKTSSSSVAYSTPTSSAHSSAVTSSKAVPTTLQTTTASSSVNKVQTTTTAPSPSTSSVSCPADNGKTFTSNGKTFQIECGIDHHAGDMKSVTAHGLTACIAACASTSGCVDVSLSGVACYMKSSLGATETNSGANGAKLVSSSGTSSTKKVTKTISTKRRNKVAAHYATVTNTHVNIVTETEYSTVTAKPKVKARHAHGNAHKHFRRNVKLAAEGQVM